MRTVALVGLATTTREAVRKSRADEIWTMNWSYNYDFIPRIDRLFEMHPIWTYAETGKVEYTKPKEHWTWLHLEHPFPIYMTEHRPEIPSCVRYPIETVTAGLFGERLIRGTDLSCFYSSSVDYMLALAIHERWDVIELYGIEMGSETEYRYQREGAAFFIGQAVGRGITVKRQAESVLLRAKMYGYEGGQMIFRQDLERMLAQWRRLKAERVAKVQNLEGRLQSMAENGVGDDEQMELAFQLRDADREMCIAEGAIQNLVYCIREVDLEEPEIELVNPFVTVDR